MILDPGGKLYLPEMVIELMVYLRRDIVDVFIQCDECGGFCVCNIMSRMSGYVLLSSKFYDLECFHNHA